VKITSGAVTLKDIAEKSSVSIATVSRILNGRDTDIPIREETRQRVLVVAAELGYRPNLLARGLRGSNSTLLGVILRDISDPFHIQILQGINDTASRRGYRLFLANVDYQPDTAVSYSAMFEQSHTDGILMIGDIEGDEAALDVLLRQHRFVVGVTDRVARRQFPGAYADSYLGTQLALDHLWNLGHRNIICISDPRNDDGRLRAEIYKQFMHDHGIERRSHVYMTTQDPEASYQVGREIFLNFSGPDRPTAIYAASDTIAICIIQAAFQAGINIPKQVSIVGFDNIDITPFTVPPLTTINQFGVKMGECATNLLLDMIEQHKDSSEVNDVVLSPILVLRQSTTVPPSL
jgi:LacI family transcriptional regulator